MVCKNCGSELPDSAKFCSKCGSSQKPSDTASKQLNYYLEIWGHIKELSNSYKKSENKNSNFDSVEIEEKVQEVIVGIVGWIVIIIYMIVMGFSWKNFFIGLIIGLIISSVINATIGLLISKVVGFVVDFLYEITDSSRNFNKKINKKINYWRKDSVFIKVKQLQETACQKYMHMSIAEFATEKFNAGFGENRRISDLLKLSEQKPNASLEQLIDIYYSGLFRQVIIERIFDLSAEHTKFIHSLETENNKCPAEIMNRLHCCEDSLEKLIDDADDMSDLELLERVSEASDIFHALCKELEEIKNKEKLEAERLKKEEEQHRKEEEEHRKKEEEQRKKDFPPACYTDINSAEQALYELRFCHNEKLQFIHDEAYDLAWEFFRSPSYGKAEKKLLSVINHTIDAIRYDDDSLIEKLSAEREEYKKLFEETKRYSKDSNASSDNYSKTTLDVSSEIVSTFLRYGVASIGRKILCKCGDCTYYRQGYCYATGKMVSKSGGSCSSFEYNG